VAGDLIPPPSPAGRPEPDPVAEAHATRELQEATQLAADARPGPAPFRGRFGFVWGALAGIVACAAVLTVILVTAAGDSGPPLAKHWSSWKPSTSRMLDGAQDISTHVAREYKLSSGDQLASIRSGRIEIAGQPLGVAVRPKGGELQVLKGDGLLYLLSLLDTDKAKKASKARERLLRREALELSLYTFRYLDDVTMVAVVLPPPGKGSDAAQSRVIFYRPGDLLKQLQVPLTRTLTVPSQVDSLALRNLFNFTIQPLDGELSYLVLVEPDVVTGS
jgi:hypothetical protein